MISRLSLGLSLVAIGALLWASSTPAQRRGMRVAAAAPRTSISGGTHGRAAFAHRSRGRFFNDSGWLASPYYYWDDESDDGPEVPPTQTIVAQPAPTAAPAAIPIEALVIEDHNGEWVRMPTGSEMAVSQSTKSISPQAASAASASAEPVAPSPAQLPPAVLVFRDGHMEEVGKYMIQGGVLYATSDYWNTGSWTRKIPLKQLDIPASLKLNQSLGTKFNLPSGPNEVMVRF